ncbi:MAG: hypothetical protein GWN71_30165, partial [Gammaproteobacteria bacterium]|nr:hypothetical protein [Gemmatimonadota bacterium]NIU77664.1 hypothetical protein [Gammaproteobacteria bacterium]
MKGRSCGTRRRALAALAVLAPAVAFAGRTFEPPGAGMAGAAPPAGIGAEGGPGGELRPGVGYVAGEVLVTFRPEVAAGLRSDVVRARGDRMAKGPEGRPRMARVAVRSGRTVPEAVRAYRTDPRIEHAQPNFLYYAQRIPDDPGFPLQWGLR